jgi:hypothetical protein
VRPARRGKWLPAGLGTLACPVQTECLAYALEHGERFGVWGGLSERARRKLQRPMVAPPARGGPTRDCRGCGAPFAALSSRQRYCRPTCADESRREQWRAAKAASRTVHSVETPCGQDLAESA